jgi:hypothetical protein
MALHRRSGVTVLTGLRLQLFCCPQQLAKLEQLGLRFQFVFVGQLEPIL